MGLHHSRLTAHHALAMDSIPPLLPLLGLLVGYGLLLCFNPIRLALRDGFRCITRFKRVWLTFTLLSLAYGFFQLTTFVVGREANLDPAQIITIGTWAWPRLADVWRDTPLPVLEGVAGI